MPRIPHNRGSHAAPDPHETPDPEQAPESGYGGRRRREYPDGPPDRPVGRAVVPGRTGRAAVPEPVQRRPVVPEPVPRPTVVPEPDDGREPEFDGFNRRGEFVGWSGIEAPEPPEDRPAAGTGGRKRLLTVILLSASLIGGVAGIAGTSCSPSRNRQATATASSSAIGTDAVQAALGNAVSDGAQVTFTAQYLSTGGATVAVDQNPPERSYRGSAVTYLLSPDNAYLCKGTVSCQRADGSDEMAPEQARAVSTAFAGSFITPEGIVSVLDAMLDLPGATAIQTNRTIDDADVGCVVVSVGSGPKRTACFSSAGVLAFYDGVNEKGVPVKLELRSYQTTTTATDFTPPKTAKVTDVTQLSAS